MDGIEVKEHILDLSDESLKGTPFDQINVVEDGSIGEIEEEREEQIIEENTIDNVDVDDSELEEEQENDEDEESRGYLLAQYFKSEGYISEDTDIPKDIDKDSLKDLISKEYIPKQDRIDAMLYERAIELGLDESTLKIAHMVASGVDLSSLNKINSFNTYINTDIDSDKDRENVIRAMYKDRGLSDKEIDRLVFDAQADNEDEDLAKNAVKYFSDKRDSYIQNAQQEQQRLQQEQKTAADQINKQLRSLLSSRKINGEEIDSKRAREFEKAVFDRTETIQQGDQTYTISPAYKKWMEFQQDPEKMLHLFYKIYYDEYASDEKRVEQKVKEDFFDKLASDVIEKKGTQTINKNSKQKKNSLSSLIEGLHGERITI